MEVFVRMILDVLHVAPSTATEVLVVMGIWLVGLILIQGVLFLVRLAVEHSLRKSATVPGLLCIDRGLIKGAYWLGAPLFSAIYCQGLVTNPVWIGVGLSRLTLSLLIVAVFVLISRILGFVDALYMRNDLAKERPITGYIQISQVFFWLVAAVLIFSVISDQEPWGLLSGLGALSAVILLIFKDSLQGLMASIALTTNHMVRIGDWIELTRYGADGEVVEINLQSVKVRNWDMSYVTFPIYALVGDGFRNLRGMRESGGRLVRRVVLVDLRSIVHGEGYHEGSLEHYRQWLLDYLKTCPGVNAAMPLAVRLLDPMPQGLPVEISCFSQEKQGPAYDATVARVLTSALRGLEQCGLRAFQAPAG